MKKQAGVFSARHRLVTGRHGGSTVEPGIRATHDPAQRTRDSAVPCQGREGQGPNPSLQVERLLRIRTQKTEPHPVQLPVDQPLGTHSNRHRRRLGTSPECVSGVRWGDEVSGSKEWDLGRVGSQAALEGALCLSPCSSSAQWGGQLYPHTFSHGAWLPMELAMDLWKRSRKLFSLGLRCLSWPEAADVAVSVKHYCGWLWDPRREQEAQSTLLGRSGWVRV